MEVAGASALVAGGASGLGAATARRLAEAGAKVVILDRDPTLGRADADEQGALFRGGDVTRPGDVAAALAAAVDQGPLSVCVVCAGVGGGGMIVDHEGRPHRLAEFERTVRINITGTFNVLRLAAAAMVGNEPGPDGERGVIVTTASIAAFEGQAGASAYAASKAALVGLTLPAARDLADRGVRVLTIAPGLFDTPLAGGLPTAYRERLARDVPCPARYGHPTEFAELVLALVRIQYLNGVTIRLDGGLRATAR